MAIVLWICSKYTRRKITENFFIRIYFENEFFWMVSHLMMGPALGVKDYSYLNKRGKDKFITCFNFLMIGCEIHVEISQKLPKCIAEPYIAFSRQPHGMEESKVISRRIFWNVSRSLVLLEVGKVQKEKSLGLWSKSLEIYIQFERFMCFGLFVWFLFNVPVNNFSVMLRRSHLFLGITSTFGE